MTRKSVDRSRGALGPPYLSRVSGAAVLTLLVAGCSALSGPQTGPVRPSVPSPDAVGQPAPGGTVQLLAVSCAPGAGCWAVGSPPVGPAQSLPGPHPAVIEASPDGGFAWRPQTAVLPSTSTLSGISCPDRLDCMAVGATSGAEIQGAVTVTADGGRHWLQVAAPSGAIDVFSVRCLSAGHCLVLATDGTAWWTATTTNAGRVFQRGGNLPSGFSGPGALDCPAPSTCEVAGYLPSTPGHGKGAIAITSDGGTTWVLAKVPDGVGLLHALTCSVNDKCVAVGTASSIAGGLAPSRGQLLTSNDRMNWSVSLIPGSVDDSFAVACPTSLTCAVVGTHWSGSAPPTPTAGLATTTDGGRRWKQPSTRYVPIGLSAIDCATPRSCVAVGGDVLVRLNLPTVRRR